MTAELGFFSLILAFLVSAVQAVSGYAGAYSDRGSLMHTALRASYIQVALICFSGFALIRAFVVSDFSLSLVVANSHIDKPLLYKIAGSWGNHEGSMLMWAFILALYGALFARLSSGMPLVFRARVLATQALVAIAFLSFILFTSNPFARIFPAPFEGMGLNPILQDPALAAHPPLLYAGYVGYSLCFSFAVAAMLEKQAVFEWTQWVRKWALAAWVFLTAGIAMGSFWAYYELGWGGFWFWDPVENASLMPWLAGTAFLHSIMVTGRKGQFVRWTLLLAIMTFALSLIGTFLVRSGVLTSVHAFANDPGRGVYILLIIGLAVGGALTLYARHQMPISAPQAVTLLSREAALLLNNIFLATATATVLIGTLYPLLIDALGLGKISVGPPYFSAVFIPLSAPFFAILPLGPILPWGQATAQHIFRVLSLPLILACLASLSVYFWRQQISFPVLIALLGAAWLIFAPIVSVAQRLRLAQPGRWQRLTLLPARFLAGSLAHAGVGVMVLGIIGATAWRQELVAAVEPGETLNLGQYSFVFDGVREFRGPNYVAEEARLRLLEDGQSIVLTPQKRLYTAERSQTTEAAIDIRFARHIYVVLGEKLEGGARVIRIWEHPLVLFIWLGGVMMACAGLIGIFQRRG